LLEGVSIASWQHISRLKYPLTSLKISTIARYHLRFSPY
jgi:hypothetical protein